MLSMLIHTNSFYIICLQTNSDESYSLVIFTQLALDAIVMLARTRMHPPAPMMLNTSFDGLRKCTTVSTPVHFNVDELSEQFVARMPNVSLQVECKKQHTVEDQSKLHDLLNGNVDNNGVYNSNELNRQSSWMLS